MLSTDVIYTSTTTSKALPSIYSMHLPLQSRLKAFGGSVLHVNVYIKD